VGLVKREGGKTGQTKDTKKKKAHCAQEKKKNLPKIHQGGETGQRSDERAKCTYD